MKIRKLKKQLKSVSEEVKYYKNTKCVVVITKDETLYCFDLETNIVEKQFKEKEGEDLNDLELITHKEARIELNN
jgi:hypothetical protein